MIYYILSSQGKAEGKGGESKAGEGEKQQAAVKAEKVKETTESSNAEASSSQEALMTEVTTLLRSLRTESNIKKISVKKVGMGEESTLIDGGATHCLRQKKSEEEWKRAKEVKVQLAAGETQMRQCEETGTLLFEEGDQTIIPVTKLVGLGYVIKWDKEECKIEHMKEGQIEFEMRQGCPTVGRQTGNKF